MQAIGIIVVESIMSKTLINWQSNVIEPSHFHNAFASIIMYSVVTAVTNDLEEIKKFNWYSINHLDSTNPLGHYKIV